MNIYMIILCCNGYSFLMSDQDNSL